MARTLREQIDWQALHDRTRESAFAKAFFTLARELGIASPADTAARRPATPASRPRVRVVEG
jgi:hypothetical protein